MFTEPATIIIHAYGAELTPAQAEGMLHTTVAFEDMAAHLGRGMQGGQVDILLHTDYTFDIVANYPGHGKFILSVDLDTKEALWKDIKLEEEKHGKGMLFVGNAMDLSLALEMEKIKALAVMKGSHIWAEAGFTPETEDWRLLRTAQLPKRLAAFEGELGEAVVEEIRGYLNDPDPRAIRKIVDHPAQVETPEGKMSLDKVLLFDCGGWNGEIATSDTEAMTRFRNYTTRHSFARREHGREENAGSVEPQL